MFHVAGVTPEAPDLATATRGRPPLLERHVTYADLMEAHRQLTSAAMDSALGGVSLGTPHLSRAQLVRMADTLAGRSVRVPTYATTSRSVTESEPDAVHRLEECGVTVVRDTCIYGPSKVLDPDGAMMTNSAKWAYYAPRNSVTRWCSPAVRNAWKVLWQDVFWSDPPMSESGWCEGVLIVGGPASGPLLALAEPLSFWVESTTRRDSSSTVTILSVGRRWLAPRC